MKAKEITKALDKVPNDPYEAFAWFVSQCASGLYKELLEKGRTDTQARNSAIHCFLDFAAGEACRVARREGREPNQDKWRKATDAAFERAVKRTEATAAVSDHQSVASEQEAISDSGLSTSSSLSPPQPERR